MARAIVGANWGDEGKGKITDMLAQESDIVIRFQGGSNAGHTIINNYGRFAMHLLPSGVFSQHTVNIIGNGVALNIPYFIKELNSLTEQGVPKPNIMVSDRAQILMPYHVALDTYEEEGLERLAAQIGKRRKKRVKQIKRDNRRTHKRISRTDPEAGHLKRPGKPEGPHYLSHQAVDSDYGIIVGQTVTPGDVNDSAPYLDLMEYVHTNVVPIQIATADAAYDFPLAHRVLGDLGIDFFVRPQKTAVRANTQFTRDDFRYDEVSNVYLCPGEKELRLRRLARSASGLFWEYQADKRDCAACPLHDKCLSENDRRGARKVSVSYFTADRRRNLERRCSPEYREALKLRQIWCEGTFAAQKREHNLTRVLRRGIEAAEDHCLLSAAVMNLKRMIKYTD